jgi:L-threonylcarbamoyladenylate synthase
VETVVLKVDPAKPDKDSLRYAADALKRGGLVAFPTETVYGLGALISKREAVKRIFEVKGRPLDNPLIVHVSGVSMFLELVENPPEEVVRLVERFWPGPLTVVWWKKPLVPDEVTAGLSKVAVRSPAHPVALKLIELSGEAIAAPSANKSGKPSPTRAEHVVSDLYGLIDVVVDAGETIHGLESTIVDLTVSPPRLLRPGALPIEEVERALGVKLEIPHYAKGHGEAEVALSPGMKYKHYAPEAELVVVEADDYSSKLADVVVKVRELASRAKEGRRRVAVLCSSETRDEYLDLGVEVLDLGSRQHLFAVAKRLFAILRELDAKGIDYAVAEGFEERGLGLAIMNRLRKASGGAVVRI